MDKYDEAVKYLTEHPDEIYQNWENPTATQYGCLFGFCCPEGIKSDGKYGCLTMVRLGLGNKSVFLSEELTEAIRNDERLPEGGCDIKVEHLPVFAEWWRKLDKHFAELGYASQTMVLA